MRYLGLSHRRLRYAGFILYVFVSAHLQAVAQIVVSGQTLSVTTTNATATFQGPDLIGLTNTSTGESYLKSASPTPLMNLEIQGAPSQNLQASNWTTSIQGETTVASLTMQDSIRTVTISVKVDSASQEIVMNLSGQATQTGVSAAYWGIAGLDLTAGHLIVPACSGIVIDRQHQLLGSTLQYPYDWQAQMAVYESSAGSVVLYSTDSQYLFKQLRIASRGNSTLDLLIATQPNGPWSSDALVPSVEWRLKAFAGDWRKAAAVYRDWLAVNRPPVPGSSHTWVNNIRTVVQLGTLDPTVLATLATELTPSETLLYIPGWRQSGYDVNYPDYTSAAGVASLVAQAHALGFKVMLHTDMIGVTPSNPDFASVQQWQVRDPATLQPEGWLWSSPTSTPNRFAFIDPASSTFRSLFITRVAPAVAAIQPDALHLDVSSAMLNDGNGIIQGMNYPQGAVQLQKDLIAAFPNLAFGGEGMNDILYPFNSFAQNWWSGDNTTLLGHPIVNYLWNSNAQRQVLYYGHLGQPAATDPGFVAYLTPIERQGILPALAVNGASDLDLTNADNARLNLWLSSWQTNALQPDWTGTWSSVLVPYRGALNVTGALSDSGTILSLNAGGNVIYQRAHNSNQFTASGYILNWPAFDSQSIYGLDPSREYWVDAIARPNTTHASSLAAGIDLGADTAVSAGFAMIQLAATPLYDFFANLWAATAGTTYQGTDGPLTYGATAQLQSITAGGVTREGIFMQPPFLQNHAGGETFVEWSVAVPQSVAFSFSVGVADSAGTCTDGVLFRVVVNGVETWQQNVLHQGWVDGSVDFSSFAGTTARLRIVTNPGAAGNPNCDWASFSKLAFLPLGSMQTNVPIVLAPGAIFSGFTGSGTYSANTGTVSGVSVPGEFVLFTALGSPVNAGSGLASLPFTAWLGGDGQLAAPGTVFGSGTVGTAVSGGVAKQNAIFGHPPYYGRTILSWTLALPSTGNLQLGWAAGIGDGSLSSTGVQFSVKVNGIIYWTMFQPGPQGWTPASLDLSSWRGQNIVVQLVTDSVGMNDFDWAWWADLTLSTGGSMPPATPVLTAPANGATGVASTPILTWNVAAGATSYDVYFGTSPSPPLVANVSSNSYAPGALSPGVWYWQVVARSATGTASSSVWSFAIGAAQDTLTVSTIGNGTVTSSDSFINCGASCIHIYLNGTGVVLTATPAQGWALTNWTGCDDVHGNVCNVAMNNPRNVTATFKLAYLLSVSTSGSGTVISGDGYINCGTACSHSYPSGTTLALTAMPSVGSTLSGWTSCTSTQANVCIVAINGATTVSAIFSSTTVVFGALSFAPSNARSGQTAVGTLSFSSPTPSGGITLKLTSNRPSSVHVPATLYVRGGLSVFKFGALVMEPRPASVTVTVTDGTSSVGGVLHVVGGAGSTLAPKVPGHIGRQLIVRP